VARIAGAVLLNANLTTGEAMSQPPVVDDVRVDLSGRTIGGDFLLTCSVGHGAIGTVYEAEQISLGKRVVLKVLHPHLLGDRTFPARFHHEAKAASRLNHPNIISVIDFGQSEDGLLYIAMEYVAGKDLAHLLYDEFPIPLPRLCHIGRQICAALDEAHAQGVVHRDLKPENIMIEPRRQDRDFVKVLDFGIAAIQDQGADVAADLETHPGTVFGTPEYMAPEQARGEPVDARSDLYSLGVVFYQLATRKLPFVGETPLDIMKRHVQERPVPLRNLNPALDAGLEALVMRMLAKKPAQRPQSAQEVSDALEAILHHSLHPGVPDRRASSMGVSAVGRPPSAPHMIEPVAPPPVSPPTSPPATEPPLPLASPPVPDHVPRAGSRLSVLVVLLVAAGGLGVFHALTEEPRSSPPPPAQRRTPASLTSSSDAQSSPGPPFGAVEPSPGPDESEGSPTSHTARGGQRPRPTRAGADGDPVAEEAARPPDPRDPASIAAQSPPAPAPAKELDALKAEAAAFVARGDQAAAQGDCPLALKAWRDSLARFPRGHVYKKIGRCSLKIGDCPAARKAFSAFLLTVPDERRADELAVITEMMARCGGL